MALGYRYPRTEPATALPIPARRASFSGHPHVVEVKTGRNSSMPQSSARSPLATNPITFVARLR
jgi:hypothetical protein